MSAPNDKPASLPESDARAIIRLLGEVTAVEGGIIAQKKFLMEGLCILIDADSWAWATTFRFEPGENPRSSGFSMGGFTPEQFAKFQEALEHLDTGRLNSRLNHEFEQKGTHLTRLRDQIEVERRFRFSDAYPIWLAAGIEEVILSIRPIGEGAISHLGLYRRPGRPVFTERESRIAHIVLSEVPWLHEAALPTGLGSAVMTLSPRQRVTLHLLLEGQTRPQIAAHLGLSYHTVDGYAKEVFRYFKVHSQPELIARFQSGDGGDAA